MIRYLFICTGNVYRSVIAHGYLATQAAKRGLDVTVSSAGTLAGDRPASPDALEVMGEDSLQVADRRSRLLAADELRQVDLVLGMAHEHVREAVIVEPSAWPKTFTLKELVRRGEAAGPRSGDEALVDWLERVAGDRKRQELLGSSEEDDVADPIGTPMSSLQATAADIRSWVERMLLLTQPAPR